MNVYDIAVLGSGPGGYTAALRAAARGAKVCLIEASKLGGTCLNAGCIPTKVLAHVGHLAWRIRSVRDYGLRVENLNLDRAVLAKRVGEIVTGLGRGIGSLLKARGVSVLFGRGRFLDAGTLLVETVQGAEKVLAKSTIIATGSRPDGLPYAACDGRHVLSADQAAALPALPESVLIVGGGIVGCELASIYAGLGIPVSLVETRDRLLGDMDADASVAVLRSLRGRSVEVYIGSRLVGLSCRQEGIMGEMQDGRCIRAACAIVAAGRRANTEGIGLENVGVRLEDGVISVDDCCRTNVANFYAVGDVAEKRRYAHLAARMGIVAADNATGHAASDKRDVVPAGLHTDPEVAVVGLPSEGTSLHTRTARFPYSASGMARLTGQISGFVKIVASADSGRICGGVVVGPHATEVIHEIAIAMRHGLTVAQVADTIHAHPTFAEAVGEAALSWLGFPLHSL